MRPGDTAFVGIYGKGALALNLAAPYILDAFTSPSVTEEEI